MSWMLLPVSLGLEAFMLFLVSIFRATSLAKSNFVFANSVLLLRSMTGDKYCTVFLLLIHPLKCDRKELVVLTM
jgi:hypothetical protein